MDKIEYSKYLRYEDGKLYWIAKSAPNANRVKIGDEAFRYDEYGYKRITVNKKNTTCHRVVWEMHNGAIPKGMCIDHINRVRDDNRIENLRLVTQSQNALNSKLKSTNTTGIKGLCLLKNPKLTNGIFWQANFRGKVLYSGTNFAKAYRARLKAIQGCEYSTSL
jgi:hypothetical protein